MAVYGCYRGYSSQLCTLGVAITHELGSLIKLPAYWDCTNKKRHCLTAKSHKELSWSNWRVGSTSKAPVTVMTVAGWPSGNHVQLGSKVTISDPNGLWEVFGPWDSGMPARNRQSIAIYGNNPQGFHFLPLAWLRNMFVFRYWSTRPVCFEESQARQPGQAAWSSHAGQLRVRLKLSPQAMTSSGSINKGATKIHKLRLGDWDDDSIWFNDAGCIWISHCFFSHFEHPVVIFSSVDNPFTWVSIWPHILLTHEM